MPTKIAFLDLSGGKKFNLDDVQQIDIADMIAKVRRDSGRTLHIRSETAFAYIGIVKYDSPVGYGVFALRDIPKDTDLFLYGGKLISADSVPESAATSAGAAYSLPVVGMPDQLLDAGEQGDIGSLCPHLPKPEALSQVVISEQQSEDIQYHNLTLAQTSVKGQMDVIFSARQFIPRGSVLGFSYGINYWVTREISPAVFTRQGDIMHDLKVLKPLICMHIEGEKEVGTSLHPKDVFVRVLQKAMHTMKPRSNLITLYDDARKVYLYVNKRMATLVTATTVSNQLYQFIQAKEITSRVESQKEQSDGKLLLNLSIFASNGTSRGPFRDVYVGLDPDEPAQEEVSIQDVLSQSR